MKKVYLAIAIMSFFLVGCGKGDIAKDKNMEVDINQSILVELLSDNKEIYKFIENGNLSDLKLENLGNLKVYSEESDITVFFSGDKLNIHKNGESRYVDINGQIENIKIAKDGKSILYKIICDTKVFYKVLNLESLEEYDIPESILISSNAVEIVNLNNIIFYGVDLINKEHGIFKYDLLKDELKTIKEINNSFISYLDVCNNEELLYFVSENEKNYIKLLNLKSKEKKSVLVDFKAIDSSILVDRNIYINANDMGSNNFYRFNLDNNTVKRMTYGFPESLGRGSGFISKDSKVFFVDINGYIYYYDTLEESINRYDINDKNKYKILDK